MKILLSLTLISLLGGCAHMPGEQPQQPISQSNAVDSLYQQGLQHYQAGEVALAQAAYERALRIEPANAQLWYQLAQLAYEQKDEGRAQELAMRARSLAGEDRALQRRISKLLSRVD